MVFGNIIIGFYFIKKERFIYASLFLGLACVSKQHAWAFIPLFLIYLYLYHARARFSLPKIAVKVLKISLPLLAIITVILLPFYLWSPKDFIDDIARYATGTISTNYPISGMGFAQIVLRQGWVNSRWDYYPFWLIQCLVLFPVVVIFWKIIKMQVRPDYLIFSYAILLFIFFYFSRAFNQNYFGNIFCIIILALFFKPEPLNNNLRQKNEHGRNS